MTTHLALVTQADAWQAASAWGDESRWLSSGEQARLASLSRPARRQQFIACRWLLRQLMLWAYPEAERVWPFTAQSNQAPGLSTQPNLFFSLSHSGQMLLAAVSEQPVGVDLERWQASRSRRELADQFCHPEELQALALLGPLAAERRLLEYWSLKEAWGKRTPGEWPNARQLWLELDTGQHASLCYWWHGDYVCAMAAAAPSQLQCHGLLATEVPACRWGRLATSAVIAPDPA